MKRILLTAALLILLIPMAANAKTTLYADILATPAQYVGKAVTVTGMFAYSEPMRESFTINQDNSMIEVFYKDLSPEEKAYILALKQYSKTSITATGVVQRFANSANTFFLNATSLEGVRTTGAVTAAALPQTSVVPFTEITSSPAKYIGKTITLRGEFAYAESVRESFTIEQNRIMIEVFYKDLSKADRERILAQKKLSKTPVLVTGTLQRFANSADTFFMNASAISW